MPFLKATDPEKRDQMIKELIELRKNIYHNTLNERLGVDDLEINFKKLYKPLIDSQSGIKEGLSKLENKADQLANTFSSYPALLDSETKAITEQGKIIPPEVVNNMTLGAIATEYLKLYTAKNSKKVSDDIFGIHYNEDDKKFYIGKKPITIEGNEITIEDKKYIGTPGLWEIIVKSHPDRYTNDDRNKYKEILDQTDAISSDLNPTKPRSSRSYKYTNVIKPIWEEITGKSGKGVIILPSDPDELVKMLQLRISAFKAGNTGARNEAIAICDELLRQGMIDSEYYKEVQIFFNVSGSGIFDDISNVYNRAKSSDVVRTLFAMKNMLTNDLGK
ncbi:uncharacterized protein LOC136096640 [Hydra vulgaris]|uniref:uncharacterized protein LOC136096640 n=1 Tax=Hydra vulgaris TaxID=6087 RepID=UPI0032EA5BD6